MPNAPKGGVELGVQALIQCAVHLILVLIISSHPKLKFVVLNKVTLLVSQTIKGTNIIVNPVNNGL